MAVPAGRTGGRRRRACWPRDPGPPIRGTRSGSYGMEFAGWEIFQVRRGADGGGK